VLAAAGTVSAVLYAFGVAPGAKTRFEAAILVFTAAAAITGYLGVLVGWLSYRLEAGKIPRPDLAIVSEGNLVHHWDIEIELLDPEPDAAADLRTERERMESVIANLRPADPASKRAAAIMGPWIEQVSETDVATYRKEVDGYLGEYEEYLRKRHLASAFWARSRRLVFAFTNERAGVPAEGVRTIIHVPTDEDMRLIAESDIPEVEDAPRRPTPPRARSLFDFAPILPTTLLRTPTLAESLGALRDVEPQGNVSPPVIREGSTVVEFSVKEILHNLYEDSRDYLLVLFFNRAGVWTIPYEVHARNLPAPKGGRLTVTVRVREREASSPN